MAEPSIASAFPNIYDMDQLEEFAAATDTPEFSDEELARVAELYANDFRVEGEPAGSRA